MRYYDIKYKIPNDPGNPSGNGIMMVYRLCPDNQAASKIKTLEENWGAIILEIKDTEYLDFIREEEAQCI